MLRTSIGGAMPYSRDRRGGLARTLAAGLLVAVSPGVHAVDGLVAVALTDQVVQVTGAGTNVVVLRTDDGLVMAGGGAPEHADALLAFLHSEFDGAPVRALFTLHWRPPHTGANEAIGATGARIIAHENTRQWMGTEYYVEWEKTTYRPQPAAAHPTDTFRSHHPQPLTLTVGDQRIEYGHLAEAYTDGDIYVYFRDQNVMVVGEVLNVDAWPVPDYATGGWIGGLQDATRLLIELTDDDTQVVAAQGPVRTRGDLIAQADMLDEMHERIRVRMIAARSVEEIVADDVASGFESYGDPTRFVSNVYLGLWWGGRLRGAY
jgi:cyclase